MDKLDHFTSENISEKKDKNIIKKESRRYYVLSKAEISKDVVIRNNRCIYFFRAVFRYFNTSNKFKSAIERVTDLDKQSKMIILGNFDTFEASIIFWGSWENQLEPKTLPPKASLIWWSFSKSLICTVHINYITDLNMLLLPKLSQTDVYILSVPIDHFLVKNALFIFKFSIRGPKWRHVYLPWITRETCNLNNMMIHWKTARLVNVDTFSSYLSYFSGKQAKENTDWINVNVFNRCFPLNKQQKAFIVLKKLYWNQLFTWLSILQSY